MESEGKMIVSKPCNSKDPELLEMYHVAKERLKECTKISSRI
jgi:hypothetical protein